jgi:biotin transport system substrate-specific component
MVFGSIALYACGLIWLKTLTGMPWPKAFAVGMLPFLVGDALKIIAAAAIARALRPIIRVAGYELRVASSTSGPIDMSNNPKSEI